MNNTVKKTRKSIDKNNSIKKEQKNNLIKNNKLKSNLTDNNKIKDEELIKDNDIDNDIDNNIDNNIDNKSLKNKIKSCYDYINLFNEYKLLDNIFKNYIEEYEDIYKKDFDINILLSKKNKIERYIENEEKKIISDYKCPICKTFNNTIKTIQMRASDEPEDIILTCFNKECKNFNNPSLIREFD